MIRDTCADDELDELHGLALAGGLRRGGRVLPGGCAHGWRTMLGLSLAVVAVAGAAWAAAARVWWGGSPDPRWDQDMLVQSFDQTQPDIKLTPEYMRSPEAPPVLREWSRRWRTQQLLYSTEVIHPTFMPNLGNGYMATQIGRESMYVNGVFDGAKESSHRARVPSPITVRPERAPSGTALDFERGSVERIFLWPHAYAVQRTYFHQALQHLAVTELEINNSLGEEQLVVNLTGRFPEAEWADFHAHVALRNESVTCVEAATKVKESPATPSRGITLCSVVAPTAYVLAPGKTLHALLPAVVWTTMDGGARTPLQAALADLASSVTASPRSLYSSHVAAMRERWRSGIEVEGNPELAKKVNSSWWNLLLSYREFLPYSSSPGGLANDCYKGHTFWDVETFMWPNLLMFHPVLAQASLQYRSDRSGAAKGNAVAHGFEGLQFPWESAITGEEVCHWGPGLREVHIGGDISLAFWQYWQATGDEQWLRDVGWPVLRGVAEFWASRAAPAPQSPGAFTIRDVVDVDENFQHAEDSSYTNAVAKLALRNAAEAARLVGGDEGLRRRWTSVADGLPILVDAQRQRHPEFASDAGGSNGLGAIMLQYPLGQPMAERLRRNDLDFYAHSGDRSQANAMYWWAYVIAWLALDEPDIAAGYLDQTTARNVFGPFHIWSENPDGSGCPNFVTGAGGFLQTLWAGYGGLRLTDEALTLHHPRVPPKSKALSFRGLAYRGSLIDIRITATHVSLQLNKASQGTAPAILVQHTASGREVALHPESRHTAVFHNTGNIVLQPVAS